MYCLGDQRTYDFLARVLAFFPPFTEKSVSVAGCALGVWIGRVVVRPRESPPAGAVSAVW